MKTVYAFVLAGLLLAGCFKNSSSPIGRFHEPLRSQMMIQVIMSGTPITLALCWEENLVKQGITSPTQISKDAFIKAQKVCEKEVVPQLKEEINKAMAEEEASEAI